MVYNVTLVYDIGMNSMELAQLTKGQAQIAKANTITVDRQMNEILRIADYLEKGTRNTTRLMELTGLSRPTVVKYRNEAIKVIHRDNKAFNTEALRNMEIGRLSTWIEKLQDEINKLGDDKDDREYKNKLLGRLDNFQGRLHAITGLNTTVNVNYEEKKRITFVMNTAEKPEPPSPLQVESIEGEVLEQPTS